MKKWGMYRNVVFPCPIWQGLSLTWGGHTIICETGQSPMRILLNTKNVDVPKFHCRLRLPEGTRYIQIYPNKSRAEWLGIVNMAVVHQASCWSKRCMTCREETWVAASRSSKNSARYSGSSLGGMQHLEISSSQQEILLGCLSIQTDEFTANHVSHKGPSLSRSVLAGQRLCMLDLQNVRDLFLGGE